jgi:DTW domain-containing protein YfiP
MRCSDSYIPKILHPPSSDDPIIAPARRACCTTCLRPQRACICRWIAPVANDVDVLILQHPTEQHQAKGSARLLHLSLAQSRLEIGETFAERQLQALLQGPIDAPTRAVLLYPSTPGMTPPPPLDAAWLAQPHPLRLVVLDATWRKSLKMLHCNPLLQALPRLTLRDAPSSAYLIRKAHHAHQLSTLEAACHALAQLEQNHRRYRLLLAGFDGFVAQQLSFRDTH